MKTVWPHEFFRLDFDKMLEEGRRQEGMLTVNKGEYDLVRGMHAHFDVDVLPLILSDDWVFQAALRFASDYALDCLRSIKLVGQEAYNTQKDSLRLKARIEGFLRRAHLAGFAPREVDIPKMSDFLPLANVESLPSEMRSQALTLYEEARDQEALHLEATLRGIRTLYETVLPRVMYVARRALKVRLGLRPKPSDERLTGISEYVSWYTARVGGAHPLYPVLGKLEAFYKVARNVASHHRGLKWVPESNEVVLADDSTTLTVPVHEFSQKYRHLVYLCELGLRGILSAFCERERGAVSNLLVSKYANSFPADFPEGEPGKVALYPI